MRQPVSKFWGYSVHAWQSVRGLQLQRFLDSGQVLGYGTRRLKLCAEGAWFLNCAVTRAATSSRLEVWQYNRGTSKEVLANEVFVSEPSSCALTWLCKWISAWSHFPGSMISRRTKSTASWKEPQPSVPEKAWGPHGLHLRTCIKFLGYHYYPRLIKSCHLPRSFFFFLQEIQFYSP